MNDEKDAVTRYLSQLAGPSADDAYHSLLELGRSALPQLIDAFRVANSREMTLRLAQIVAYGQAVEAASFLVELLENPDAEIWKTALDGLVMLGTDNHSARRSVLDSLALASRTADPIKREWVVEAIEQIPPLDDHEPD